MHAEATSEKLAMAWALDGQVSAVVGTHTHVETADERVMPRGTGYITDVGMTGPYHSILGLKVDLIVDRFRRHLPVKFEVAEGPTIVSAIMLSVDDRTGQTTEIRRLRRGLEHADQPQPCTTRDGERGAPPLH
jgi:calcineurin-like phosphoesterase